MRLVKGKDAIFETDKYDVILVGTSVYDLLTHGFQGKIGKKYPFVLDANHKQPYGDLRRLGTRLTLEEDGSPIISLLYVCRYPKKGLHSLDYEALRKCFLTSAAEFKGKRIITTIIGSNEFDGEGDREKILRMMRRIFKDIDIDVYDYPQKSILEEVKEKRKQLKAMGVKDTNKCREILQKLFLI